MSIPTATIEATMYYRQIVALLFLIGVCGCSRVDPAIRDCGGVREAYLEFLPSTERFTEYDLEIQYMIFICGSQSQHPPLLFTNAMASEGEVAARFLARKLAESNHDLTTRDILDVYVEMASQGSYDVRGDVALMALLERKVQSMRPSVWRDRSIEKLERLRRR